jgi:hypothetical protein
LSLIKKISALLFVAILNYGGDSVPVCSTLTPHPAICGQYNKSVFVTSLYHGLRSGK